MDPLDRVNPSKDTSYFLMLGAQERGHDVYYVNPSHLSIDNGRVITKLVRVQVNQSHLKPFLILRTGWEYLDDVDVVWIRTDPPVDRSYFYATLLLDFLPSTVRVINRPSTIRDWNEKLAALKYRDWTPSTMVTCDIESIIDFSKEYKRLTIKPLDGHGGNGIIFVRSSDRDFIEKIQMATNGGKHWVIVQEYLEAAQEGDKRILLLNGKPIGAMLRLHKEGHELNNLDQGGTPIRAALDSRDLTICETLENDLRKNGVVFAGIDIIGGRLIEINITSPTGLQEMSRFDGKSYHYDVIKSLEL
tara:strand:- start:656 stop:1564 length:909 start_codon:yes stop_codon:yes gene_type:complete